jgi:3-mercaptopyruvate sulfurtransferase SseA
VAQQLRRQGYRAYAIRGGLDAWIDAGLPTEPKAVETRRTITDVCPDCGQPMSVHGNRMARA